MHGVYVAELQMCCTVPHVLTLSFSFTHEREHDHMSALQHTTVNMGYV